LVLLMVYAVKLIISKAELAFSAAVLEV
jgi:hypothetical protein